MIATMITQYARVKVIDSLNNLTLEEMEDMNNRGYSFEISAGRIINMYFPD